jgi:hypothetical protein
MTSKIYVIFYDEHASYNNKWFLKKEQADKWLQCVKHIPHSDVIEVVLHQ